MNLDEYKKAYMQSEGIGNTPIRFFKRYANLFNSIKSIPKAVSRDKFERNKRYATRMNALDDIKKNGYSLQSVYEAMSNHPKLSGHTISSLDNVTNNAISALQSTNELGQTSASIVGTRRNNYDSQDFEDGIRFALKGVRYIKGYTRISSKALCSSIGLACAGSMVVSDVKFHKINKDKNMQKAKEMFKEKPSMDIER